MSENRETRLRRLHMRSIRRGIREMDLIMETYSEVRLATLDDAELDLYEALLSEPDLEIYSWIAGQEQAPERYAGMVADMLRTYEAKVAGGV